MKWHKIGEFDMSLTPKAAENFEKLRDIFNWKFWRLNMPVRDYNDLNRLLCSPYGYKNLEEVSCQIIGGLWDHVRTFRSSCNEIVVMSQPYGPHDDELQDFCDKNGIACFLFPIGYDTHNESTNMSLYMSSAMYGYYESRIREYCPEVKGYKPKCDACYVLSQERLANPFENLVRHDICSFSDNDDGWLLNFYGDTMYGAKKLGHGLTLLLNIYNYNIDSKRTYDVELVFGDVPKTHRIDVMWCNINTPDFHFRVRDHYVWEVCKGIEYVAAQDIQRYGKPLKQSFVACGYPRDQRISKLTIYDIIERYAECCS